MAQITEHNQQRLQAILWFQQALTEAMNSGRGGRIVFPDDLPFSGGQLKDWTPPKPTYRESLGKIAAKP